jgi:hypothetical protein
MPTSNSRFYPTNANDIILTSFTFTNGPLGQYYQLSTNLVDKGSRTADLAGLYHYTARQSQVKETNSIVDIGLHYVALDANGQPIDRDGDYIPDYIEDSNGNGEADPGETDYRQSFKVVVTRPRDGSATP